MKVVRITRMTRNHPVGLNSDDYDIDPDQEESIQDEEVKYNIEVDLKS